MNRTMLTTTGLATGVLLFLLLNALSNATLGGARLDLTEHGLYTLSDGSRRMVATLDEPVTMRFYFSEDLAADIPPIRLYGQRVRGLLEELAASSGGRLRLETFDPEPYSEVEDAAVAAGLQGARLEEGPSDLLYFGLVGTSSTDERVVIPFFDPRREQSLEYDVSRLIYKLGTTSRPLVAVHSGLPLEGQPALPFPGAPPPQDPWYVIESMRDVFDVAISPPGELSLPEGARLLMLVHPKDLSEASLYAIDQFVLGGGHLLVFTDPFCEADVPPQDPSNPLATMMAPRGSNLDLLFRTWGFEMIPDRVLGDRTNALRVTAGDPSRPESVDYVLWVQFGGDALDDEDFVTSKLDRLEMHTAGILRPVAGAQTQFVPLVQSSEDVMQIELTQVQFMDYASGPKRLLNQFVPLGQAQTVAARISGSVSTAFPDGPPVPVPVAEDEAPELPAGHLAASIEPIQVVAVADVDILADRTWLQIANFLGQKAVFPTSSNGDLVVHALDNLSGSSDLISIRSRESFARPFVRMDELRREAEARYLAKEQELQLKLQDTERRLGDLQRQKEDGSSMILSPEQRDEIERFRSDQVATRKALREVQHDLRKDIESLEAWIKFVNIGLVPLGLGVLAAGLGAWRRRRRRD